MKAALPQWDSKRFTLRHWFCLDNDFFLSYAFYFLSFMFLQALAVVFKSLQQLFFVSVAFSCTLTMFQFTNYNTCLWFVITSDCICCQRFSSKLILVSLNFVIFMDYVITLLAFVFSKLIFFHVPLSSLANMQGFSSNTKHNSSLHMWFRHVAVAGISFKPKLLNTFLSFCP